MVASGEESRMIGTLFGSKEGPSGSALYELLYFIETRCCVFWWVSREVTVEDRNEGLARNPLKFLCSLSTLFVIMVLSLVLLPFDTSEDCL